MIDKIKRLLRKLFQKSSRSKINQSTPDCLNLEPTIDKSSKDNSLHYEASCSSESSRAGTERIVTNFNTDIYFTILQKKIKE